MFSVVWLDFLWHPCVYIRSKVLRDIIRLHTVGVFCFSVTANESCGQSLAHTLPSLNPYDAVSSPISLLQCFLSFFLPLLEVVLPRKKNHTEHSWKTEQQNQSSHCFSSFLPFILFHSCPTCLSPVSLSLLHPAYLSFPSPVFCILTFFGVPLLSIFYSYIALSFQKCCSLDVWLVLLSAVPFNAIWCVW